jgi:hypothetical protein
MPDISLPGLTPGDPENLLSKESRQRIARAFLEFDLIKHRGLVAVDLGDHWGTPRESEELVKARLDAARFILKVKAEEYGKLSLPPSQYREIVFDLIEECCYSLELSKVQQYLLEAEFRIQAYQDADPVPHPSNIAISAPQLAERQAEGELARKPGRPSGFTSAAGRRRVQDYCSRLNGGRESLAEAANVSGKSIARLLAGQNMDQSIWRKLARAMKTTVEELTKP